MGMPNKKNLVGRERGVCICVFTFTHEPIHPRNLVFDLDFPETGEVSPFLGGGALGSIFPSPQCPQSSQGFFVVVVLSSQLRQRQLELVAKQRKGKSDAIMGSDWNPFGLSPARHAMPSSQATRRAPCLHASLCLAASHTAGPLYPPARCVVWRAPTPRLPLP